MQEEIWKTMIYNGVEYENYAVSTHGRIMNKKTGNVLKCQIHPTGYYNVTILPQGRKGKCICVRIHRAVAQTFISNNENKPQVNHIDGNKLNNNIENLEWNTNSENIIHAIKNNLLKIKQGEEKVNSKLSKEDILYIRNNYVANSRIFGARALSRKFNVTHSLILNIINYKKWKSI